MQKNFTFQSIRIELLNEIKGSFREYAGSFRLSDDAGYNKHMELKQFHTEKVVEEIRELGKSIQMNQKQLAFVEVIAWLHDIGRFEQYDKYRTFSDAESENHAEMALRIIEELSLLKDFKNEQVDIICKSILNHNIPKVEQGETAEIDFYSRVLRDADKLDIWRVVIEMNIFHKIKNEKMPESYSVPDNLMSYFEDSKTIPLTKVNSYYDSILFRLSWVYDLNFEYTLIEFSKREMARKFLSKLPDSSKLDKILNQVNSYASKFVSNPYNFS